VFGIAWKHAGAYYPSQDWTDFGVVILGWWFSELIKMIRGAMESRFQFMDGPYSIDLILDRERKNVELNPDGLDVKWHFPLADLADELIRAANEVQNQLVEMHISRDDQRNLEENIRLLRASLADM
jgi:hypothetical protein